MTCLGIHHISALVSDIHTSYEFYHKTLGLKLLMKTVNQDETTMYHLFFSDETGQPGTEFTVFQINTFKENKFGTNAIDRAIFGIKSEADLPYWIDRLDQFGVEHCGIEDYNDTKIIRFEDPDGMQLGISVLKQADSDNHTEGTPEIVGLHSVHLRVRYPKATQKLLEEWFDFEHTSTLKTEAFPVTVFTNNHSDFNHEIHLIEDTVNPIEDQGVGGIHHLALFAETYGDLLETNERVIDKNLPNSGLHPREFFDAIYFREPNGILFEVASKANKIPTPVVAEAIDDVPLYLPDFLEPKRESIEYHLNKIDQFRKES